MQDWHKVLIGLAAVAVAYMIYCKQHKESMTMMQPSAMPAMQVVPATVSAGGLQPADVDPVDYATYGNNAGPCQMQEPYAA